MMSVTKVTLLLLLAIGSALAEMQAEQCHSCGCASSRMECSYFARECSKRACWCSAEYGGKSYTVLGNCRKTLETGERCNSVYGRCNDTDYCHSATLICTAMIDAGSNCDPAFSSCTSGASCELESEDNYVCMCQYDYVHDNGKCRRAGLGEVCTDSEMCGYYECIMDESEGVCGCYEGYSPLEFNEYGNIYSKCVHDNAMRDQEAGAACTLEGSMYTDTNEHARLCSSQFTCAQCHMDDPPTCMTMDTT